MVGQLAQTQFGPISAGIARSAVLIDSGEGLSYGDPGSLARLCQGELTVAAEVQPQSLERPPRQPASKGTSNFPTPEQIRAFGPTGTPL
jgi:hypothetical protein